MTSLHPTAWEPASTSPRAAFDSGHVADPQEAVTGCRGPQPVQGIVSWVQGCRGPPICLTGPMGLLPELSISRSQVWPAAQSRTCLYPCVCLATSSHLSNEQSDAGQGAERHTGTGPS